MKRGCTSLNLLLVTGFCFCAIGGLAQPNFSSQVWEQTELSPAQVEWLSSLGSAEREEQSRLLTTVPGWAEPSFVLSKTAKLQTSHRSLAVLRLPVQKGLVLLSEKLGDPRARAVALVGLAYLHESAGHLEEARSFYRQALTLITEFDDRTMEADALRSIARCSYALEETPVATETLERACSLYTDLGSNLGLARCSLIEASALAVRSRPEEALAKADEAATLLKAAEQRNVALEAEIMLSQASVLTALGRLAEADELLKGATAAATSLQDPRFLGRCLLAVGRIRVKQERLGEALLIYEEARSLLDYSGSAAERSRCYSSLASIYNGLGAEELALTLCDRALAHLDEKGSGRARAYCLVDKASISNTLAFDYRILEPGQSQAFLDLAETSLDEAKRLFEKLDDTRGMALCHSENARLTHLRLLIAEPTPEHLKDVISIMTGQSEAIKGLRGLGAERDLANVHHRSARLHLHSLSITQSGSELNHLVYAVTMGYLKEAHRLYTGLGDNQGMLVVLLDIAVAHTLGGKRQEAYNAALEVLSKCEQLLPGETNPEIAAARSGLIEDLPPTIARAAYDVGKDSEAFWLCQRAKVLPLRTALRRSSWDERKLPSDDLHKRNISSRQRYEVAAKAMQQRGWDPAVRAEYAQAVAEYQADLQRAREQHSPAEVSFSLIPSSADLAATLDGRSAIVEILPNIFETIAFVLTREEGTLRVRVIPLKVVTGELELLGHELRNAMASRKQLDDLLERLYASLLKPCLDELPPTITNLIICPSPPIHDLPIAAAKLPDGRHLIEAYTVTIAPSATAWWHARTRGEALGPGGSALLMAVTSFGGPIGAAVRGGKLAPLPEAGEEVKKIAATIRGRAKLLIDAQATPETFYSAAPHADIIHVATHGRTNPYSSMMSFLVLAASDADTGYLYAQDISELRLKATLVVLSACRGYLGQQTLAGPLGLAWAFMVAGCSSVIASQWDVDSKATKDWMLSFYESYVKHGKSKAESVQAACRKLLDNPESRHPYYWAAWTLMGSDR